MSQSFDSPADGTESPASQLATMIHRGRSFSGGERHCAFLNLGGASPRFANVSAGSGLDLPDDGRAVALVDWDHDGDLDLWISNRSAPQLRLMRNDLPAGRHFVSLRLEGNGTTTNRDAIGARVEVVAGGARLLRTLRAGEGFLAQSSAWLHFGLGGAERIDEVRVRWPDRNATAESFEGIEVNGRYRLVQGQGRATEAPRRSAVTLEASPPTLSSATRTARIPLVTLLQAPPLNVSDASGKRVTIGAGRPTLVNLWASWCAPCLAELAEIRDRERDLRAVGLEVLALSVDGLDHDPLEAAAAAGAAIERVRFPFVSALASEQVAGQLQWHHDNAVGFHRRLPLPSSFLVDAEGRVAVIYKGPVSIDQVLEDAGALEATRAERWARAAQLPGRTIEHPSIHRLADKVEGNLYYHHGVHQESLGSLDLALQYYQEALGHRPGFAPAHRSAGNLYARRSQWTEALAQFDPLAAIEPEDASARYAAGVCRQKLGETGAARARFLEAVKLDPGHVRALEALATMELLEGDASAAIAHFRALAEAAPQHRSARNNLAWLLATNGDETLRDGEEAMRLATVLVEEEAQPAYLDTLAAAQAEAGRFEEALATARRGVTMARAANDEATAAQIEARIAIYERGEAIRE